MAHINGIAKILFYPTQLRPLTGVANLLELRAAAATLRPSFEEQDNTRSKPEPGRESGSNGGEISANSSHHQGSHQSNSGWTTSRSGGKGGTIRMLDTSAGRGSAAAFLARLLCQRAVVAGEGEGDENGRELIGGANFKLIPPGQLDGVDDRDQPYVALYGVELDPERGKLAEPLFSQFVRTDSLTVRAPNAAFDLLYQNPPYDLNGKLQLQFLEHWTPKLGPGGTLVHVDKQAHLAASAEHLAAYYYNIQIYRFPLPEYTYYTQVVVLAQRRNRRVEDEKAARWIKELAQGGPQALPVLPCLAPDPRLLKIVIRRLGLPEYPEVKEELETLTNYYVQTRNNPPHNYLEQHLNPSPSGVEVSSVRVGAQEEAGATTGAGEKPELSRREDPRRELTLGQVLNLLAAQPATERRNSESGEEPNAAEIITDTEPGIRKRRPNTSTLKSRSRLYVVTALSTGTGGGSNGGTRARAGARPGNLEKRTKDTLNADPSPNGPNPPPQPQPQPQPQPHNLPSSVGLDEKGEPEPQTLLDDKRRPVIWLEKTLYDPADVLREVRSSGVWATSRNFREALSPSTLDELTEARCRPLIPLREGQAFYLITSGLMNNKMLTDREGHQVLVKGRIKKEYHETDREYDEEGDLQSVTARERLKNELVSLDLTSGQFTTMSGTEIGSFLQRYRSSLMKQLLNEFPPLYDPLNIEHNQDPTLRKIMAGIARLKRRYKGAQGLSITAGALALARYGVAWKNNEQGTGKSYVGAASSWLGGMRRVLIICPPHLVEKWVEEIKSTVPGARAEIIERKADETGAASRVNQKGGSANRGSGVGNKKNTTHSATVELDGAVRRILAFERQMKSALKLPTPGGGTQTTTVLPWKEKGGVGIEAPPPYYLVISREVLKLGMSWQPAVVEKKIVYRDEESGTTKTEVVLACPRCGGELREKNGEKALTRVQLAEKKWRCPNTLFKSGLKSAESSRRKDRWGEPCNEPLWQYVAKLHPARWEENGHTRLERTARRDYEWPLPLTVSVPVALTSSISASDAKATPEEVGDEDTEIIHCGGEETSVNKPSPNSRYLTGEDWFTPPPSLREASGPRRFPLARYIQKRHRRFFDGLILDEGHEYNDLNSAQGIASGMVAQCVQKVLLLTGTLTGGKASQLFYLLWRFTPHFRQQYGLNGKVRWIKQYGIYEKKTYHSKDKSGGNGQNEDEEALEILEDGSMSFRRQGKRELFTEKPGMNPAILLHLIGYTVFFRLPDMDKNLPPYREHIVLLSMEGSESQGDSQAGQYYRLQSSLYATLKDMLRKGSGRLLGAYIRALLSWVDQPFIAEVVTDPADRTKILAQTSALVEAKLYPKEEWLVAQYKKEHAAGRNLILFVSDTQKRSITGRLKWVLETHTDSARVAILNTSRVGTKARKRWIDARLAEGCNVLIVHPKGVATGLDLMEFPTLIFYQLEYSLYLLLQASRRSWRIGAREEIHVYFVGYRRTAQESGWKLQASKKRSAMSLLGDLSDSGLEALADENDEEGGNGEANANSLFIEIARQLMNGGTRTGTTGSGSGSGAQIGQPNTTHPGEASGGGGGGEGSGAGQEDKENNPTETALGPQNSLTGLLPAGAGAGSGSSQNEKEYAAAEEEEEEESQALEAVLNRLNDEQRKAASFIYGDEEASAEELDARIEALVAAAAQELNQAPLEVYPATAALSVESEGDSNSSSSSSGDGNKGPQSLRAGSAKTFLDVAAAPGQRGTLDDLRNLLVEMKRHNIKQRAKKPKKEQILAQLGATQTSMF